MGNELGHLREWDEKRELDWDMLKYPVHDSFHRFIKDLNQLYLEHPELWQWDYKPEGFRWIDCHQEERCIYAMERSNGYKKMIAVFNFSGVEQKAYSFESEDGVYEAALYSEQDIYGGTEMGKLRFETKKGNVTMDLPAFSAVFLVKAANEVKGKG